MSLLVVHLTDLHIRKYTDILKKRINAVAAAIGRIEPPPEQVVFAVTGDVSNSGSDEEFKEADQLFEMLADSVCAEIHRQTTKKPQIYFFACPGNHDCNLHDGEEVRSIMVEGVRRDPQTLQSKAVSDHLLRAHAPFFGWLGRRESHQAESLWADSAGVGYEYSIQIGGVRIGFVCMNTAMMSIRKEKEASLLVPIEKFPSEFKGDINLILAHHPPVWHVPNTRRTFVARLAKLGDFVLFGHEHEGGFARVDVSSHGEYVISEGHVFWDEKESQNSGFSTILIDAQERKFKRTNYRYDGNSYGHQDKSDKDWQDLPRNDQRPALLLHEPAFLDFLMRPSIALVHNSGSPVTLEKIFVWPDMKEKGLGRVERSIKGPDLLAYFLAARDCIICGDTKSGRTALLRMLLVGFRKNGLFPLMVEGADLMRAPKDPSGVIQEAIKTQYGEEAVSHYLSQPREMKVVFVDDVDKIDNKLSRRKLFIKSLSQVFDRVVLTGGLVGQIEWSTGDLCVGGRHFKITHMIPFKYKKRDELVTRWMTISPDSDPQSDEFASRRAAIDKTIDTILGNGFIPSYPFAILYVLQAFEATIPIDTRVGTFGNYYETFIRAALMRNRTPASYEILTSFLSELAYRLFKGKLRNFGEALFEETRVLFRKRFDVELPSDSSLSNLCLSEVLVENSGLYSFRYKYMYYYFTANYMKKWIDKSNDVRADITKCIENVNVEESANLLLFVAHLANEASIISQLKERARKLLVDFPPATLEADVSFLNELDSTLPTLELKVYDPTAMRSDFLDNLADHDAESESTELEDEDDGEEGDLLLVNLNAALKTLQVLGQCLKSFPGTIEADEKLEIASDCRLLGLRVLGLLLEIYSADRQGMVEGVTSAIRRASGGNWDSGTVQSKAKEAIVFMCQAGAQGVIRYTAYCIGSPELEMTHAKMAQNSNTSAERFIDLALRMETAGHIDRAKIKSEAYQLRKNPFAFRILQSMAYIHCLMFPTRMHDRQFLESKLNIVCLPQLPENQVIKR